MKTALYVIVTIIGINVHAAENENNCSAIRNCFGEIWQYIDQQWAVTEVGRSVPIPKNEKFCLGADYHSTGVEFSDGVRAVLNVGNDSYLPILAQTVKSSANDYSRNIHLMITQFPGSAFGTAYAALSSKYIGGTFHDPQNPNRVYQIYCQ